MPAEHYERTREPAPLPVLPEFAAWVGEAMSSNVRAVVAGSRVGGFTGRRGSDVGSLAHAAIALTLPFCVPDRADADIAATLLDRLYAVCAGMVESNPNKRQVLVTEAAGFAYRYLTTYVPAEPWALLGVEYDLGQQVGGRPGRVDVAWRNQATGTVLFDEVKTTRLPVRSRTADPTARVPASWLDQASRYAVAGSQAFGLDFAGVRLLPLRVMSERWLIQAGHPVAVSRLAPTPEDPTRPAPPRPVQSGVGGWSL